MKRGSTKIAELPVQLRAQVVSLRRCGHDVLTICERLHIDKPSERNAVTKICAEPGLRAYGHSIEVGGPVRRGPNRAAVIRP
jgi:hypothetical protein